MEGAYDAAGMRQGFISSSGWTIGDGSMACEGSPPVWPNLDTNWPDDDIRPIGDMYNICIPK